jgi:septal ring factor EnvC (AmiA/AmiB activator)
MIDKCTEGMSEAEELKARCADLKRELAQQRMAEKTRLREYESVVRERDEARAMLAKTSTDLNSYIAGLDNLSTAQAKTIRDLEAAIEAEKRLTERNAETARGLMQKAERAEQDAALAWDAHAREKRAREAWVQAYRDTLARAETAEQALGEVVTTLFGGNAEGMAACVTAGPQCHYELPYEACKRLLAVLKSDALRHLHVYAPDTGKCSCGHDEKDDSR